MGFLSFNSDPPKVYIATPSPHAPEPLLRAWQSESFSPIHIPYSASTHNSFVHTLKTLQTTLKLGETYALVAYGPAADAALSVALKPLPRCGSLVAYYPSALPRAKHKFPDSLRVVVHVAGLEQISPAPHLCAWKCYRYERARVGFAEPGHEAYERVEADLAWSRTLARVRKGFGEEVDVEGVVDEAWRGKYESADNPEDGGLRVAGCYSQDGPHVTVLPTLEGAVGRKKLAEFYSEFFIPSLVQDFEIRLVSRTVGGDRVVDEMVVAFTHDDEVDWILPGVLPTGKRVEVAMVSIVAVRGGKLVSEHMYWDQASVLAQVGLLDPKVVPKKFKDQGLKRLPVTGIEAARQLAKPEQERYNELLKMHGLFDGLDGMNGVNGS